MWRTSFPTKPGYYWVRDSAGVVMCEVQNDLLVGFPGNANKFEPDYFHHCEWKRIFKP